MTSCNNSNRERTIELLNQVDSINIPQDPDTLLQSDKEKDTLKPDFQITTDKTKNKNQRKNKKIRESPARMIDFPSDNNFNGKPMTQQENIPKAILQEYPDTLSKLAIACYKTYDHFFPKSIADNFEEGISTVHIHYPEKLIFRFELFETEYSWTPYIVKEVIVRRNPNGEVYTE
ncbi:MAG: hypothetical protein Q7W45_10575 [Bacteroidota bacterium]|nr:hypothetical protein [Bacteroidota bacterium]MDP3143918.1 hypothetical protein [Bacteroidota bacterium]MDP3558066.1 hypothetical protein [Bacteroidota bacterium]